MRSTGADILVVDDEADIRELVSGLLEDEGHAVRTASNSDEALAAIRARKPSLALLDIWMQGGGLDGLELLDVIKELDPDLPVVMISGHGNIETAVTALQRGAYDFIEKPFKSDRLVVVVQRALEVSSLKRENRRLRAQVAAAGRAGEGGADQPLRQEFAVRVAGMEGDGIVGHVAHGAGGGRERCQRGAEGRRLPAVVGRARGPDGAYECPDAGPALDQPLGRERLQGLLHRDGTCLVFGDQRPGGRQLRSGSGRGNPLLQVRHNP